LTIQSKQQGTGEADHTASNEQIQDSVYMHGVALVAFVPTKVWYFFD
jgi:hypothetical protein